jgi:hypothetical protein
MGWRSGQVPWNLDRVLSCSPSQQLLRLQTLLVLSLGTVELFFKPEIYFELHFPNAPCLAITLILLCAANSPASPSADSVTSATANALYAIPTCDQQRSCAFVMSAPSVTTRTSASSAVARASATLSTVSNAHASKRIVTAARRL